MLPILKKECMLFQMEADSKEEAVHQMAEVFEQEGYLVNKECFYQDVMDREMIFPTYIGYGIGLPHGKSKGVKHAGLCIAKLKKPILWTGDAESEVRLILMIAVNDKEAGDLHLQILSRLSRLLMHEEFRTELISGNRDKVYEMLLSRLEVQNV